MVAIAGPYRSGKSFLANRFLNKMKGFTIGSTVQSCTRGIWMWNRLVPINDEIEALLLDTEGLGSTDREFETDIKIFALSILLSSTFVFNQIGHINEQSIEDLSVVVRLTNELKIRDSQQEETGLEFKQFFPSFVWVLRDFSLNFKLLTPKVYLEQALESQSQGRGSLMSDDIFRKNQIRESIKNFFADLDCFTLVRPVTNEGQLAHIEELDYEKDLRPEFRQAMDNLMSKLKSPHSARVKSVNGRPLTSTMLLGLALEYVDAINSQEVPVVMNCFERVVQVESRRFTEKLYDEVCSRALKEGQEMMPCERERLEEMFNEQIAFAEGRLSEQLGEVASVENLIELREELEKRLHSFFKDEIFEANLQASD